MNSNTFARRATVTLPGNIEVEGYILPENLQTPTNKYGVSKTGAVLMCFPDYSRNQAAKRYRRLIQSKTGLRFAPQGLFVHPQVAIEGENQLVDLIPVDQIKIFLKICRKLGSERADILCDHLVDMSLQALFADSFDQVFGKDERKALMEAWYPVREKSIFAHAGFCEAIKRRRYQGNRVHDYMTLIIFGDTAQAARLKAIVSEELDASIGLNHQEDVVKLDQLATAKLKFATLKRKGESWQSQVERACAMAIKLVPNLV